MTGPQDPAAAGNGRLGAGHADHEQVIEALKDAFVHGRLTRDELDARAGRALAAWTRAELAALTADIPLAPVAAPGGPGPARPPSRGSRRPPGRAAAWSLRPPPCGSPASPIRALPAPLPIIPWPPCAF